MILTNFDDVDPVLLAGGAATYVKVAGVFGQGSSSDNQQWGFRRSSDIAIPIEANMPKQTVSALYFSRNRGSSPPNIGGVGFFVPGGSIDATTWTSAIIDGRDSTTVGSSTVAYQIRQTTLNAGGVVASANSNEGTRIDIGRVFRMEATMEVQGSNVLCSARFYAHDTNNLESNLSVTRPLPTSGSTTVYPGVILYGAAVLDCVQYMVGDEAYLSNLPVKARIGGAWVKKPMKKLKSGLWVPAYPRARKSIASLSQFVW